MIIKSFTFVVLTLCFLLSANTFADEDSVIQAGGSRFTIEWKGDYSDSEKEKLKQWLIHAGECTAMLYGSLPRDPIRVVLKRLDKANEPVPFAQVIRSGIQGVRFLVNPKYSLDEFINDWTAIHEFSHLYIPYPGKKDIWLSEGLATYYQNVLQARAGVLTEQQAWQKLYEGFMRGEANKRAPNYSLLEVSKKMIEMRSFMRVYWSGTAYFLEADLLLRQQSNNQQSLDSVIEEYVNCCLKETDHYYGDDLVKAFDQIAKTDLFYPLYKKYQQLSAQPPTQQFFDSLGINIVNGRVILLPAPESAVNLRQSIMSLPKKLAQLGD